MATMWCSEVTPHWMQHLSIWKCQKFLKRCLHHHWMLHCTQMQRGGCLWKHFWPLYLKSIGMFLRIEKNTERKPIKTSAQTVTHSQHSCSSYQKLSKAGLFLKLICWGFFVWLVSEFFFFFLRQTFRNTRKFTYLIMDPYRESMPWRVWQQVKNGIMTARNPQKTHNKISQGISLSAAALGSPSYEQL